MEIDRWFLKLENILLSENGNNYTCSAENAQSRRQFTFQLRVSSKYLQKEIIFSFLTKFAAVLGVSQTPPRIQRFHPLNMHMYVGESLNLTCDYEAAHSNTKFGWVKVPQFSNSTDDYQKLEV